jgi:radical SAM protein with 4Fe4S-binding SPASM domain
MNEQILKFYKYVPEKKPKFAGKFCRVPYYSIQIDNDGDVQLCSCTLHMPYTIGNIFQHSLKDIWHNSQAGQVRQSVWNSNFTYCNWACSGLYQLVDRPTVEPMVLEFPREIKVDLDLSCNLKCPSCREETIIEKNNDRIQKQIEVFDEITQWALAHPTTQIKLVPLSRGEIFASHSGLKFLQSLIDYPHDNLKLWLVTNGTLIKKNWATISQLTHTVAEWSVSIDASSAETYAQVRGGNWSDLLEGLGLIQQSKPRRFLINFCIQKNNYHEIESVAELANQFGATIQYQKLGDWGHWTTDWWHQNNVFDRRQPSFETALTSIRRVLKQYPNSATVSGEIAKYLEKLVDFD